MMRLSERACVSFLLSAKDLAITNTSLSGLGVARELDAVIPDRKRRAMIVSDNGTEFTSRAILRWSHEAMLDWHSIAPGKPQQKSQAPPKQCQGSIVHPLILTVII